MSRTPDASTAPTPTDGGVDTRDGTAGVDTQWLLGRARTRLLGWAEAQPLVVGRYRVTRRLGEGGMSVVYAAQDDVLGREVAIKFLHSELARTASWRERLRREAQAMAQLAHPNVAHVYEVGEHDGQAFIVMEVIGGSTLRAWGLAQARTPAEILALHTQAGRGLAAAHEAGIVHRDYKPDNVLVDETGRARVLDFGLARDGGEDPVPDTADAQQRPAGEGATTIGSLMGTPPYMAPEQLAGQPVDARADQFAFCVALFEALHGARPYAGNSVTELSASMRAAVVREHDPARPPVPEAIDRVLMRGLAQEPADRHASMTALLDAFADAEQHQHREEQAELERRARALDFGLRADRRWQHALGIGVVLAAVVGGLYGLRVLGIHEVGYPDAMGFGAVLVVLQLHSQRRMVRAGANEIDRRWARMLTMGSVVVIAGLGFAWLAGFDLTTGIAVTLFAAAAASSTVALLVDARALVSTACLTSTAFALVLAPSYRSLWLFLGILGAYASLSLVWRGAAIAPRAESDGEQPVRSPQERSDRR